jgi:hypothetical protein
MEEVYTFIFPISKNREKKKQEESNEYLRRILSLLGLSEIEKEACLNTSGSFSRSDDRKKGLMSFFKV